MASSGQSSVHSRRTDSHPTEYTSRRTLSYKKASVPLDDAYTHALRAAYLAYLLQPRQKRVQHVANTSKPIQRASTSINDMVADFKLIRDSKSTKFPHGFMAALDKRITGVLLGQEKSPEYNDALVKRTFATFLNEFKRPDFRKTMEKDRRVEDLLLIFFSRATSELQKGKPADDDSWKLMVDRHVALFVRLISGTLQGNDWTRDRPELSSRLKTLETKLLQHDQDLAASSQRAGGQGGQTIEVEVPRSYEVRDMPLVIRVASIFAKPTSLVQHDINAHKHEWTEKAALKDLKEYQNHLMLGTGVTLTKDDFDLDEAFEVWRKGESSDLTQMMLAIIQSNPELAKTSTAAGSLPTYKPPSAVQSDSAYSHIGRQLSLSGAEADSSYVIDQPVDMSHLNIDDSSPRDSGKGSMDASHADFTFIPPEVRAYYRQVLKSALTHDMADHDLVPSTATEETPSIKLLSKQSSELLNEIALRWRIPQFTRMVLFMDVIREKFQDTEINLDTLDAAFLFVKEPPVDTKKASSKNPTQVSLFDRSKWTVVDYALYPNILAALHDSLLRELYETFQHCYEAKPPSVGPVLYVLENHIYEDTHYHKNPAEIDAFAKSLADALGQRAEAKYTEMLSQHIGEDADQWEFYSVIQLGKAVLGLVERIQKRYRKNKEVMGVNPLTILIQKALPSFAEDARELVNRILDQIKARGEEVPIQDGFDLYAELVNFRQVWAQALPGREFSFHIEGLLQDFVWRWVRTTDTKLLDWIEAAFMQDEFQVRQDEAAKKAGLPPTDAEKHSQSAIDVYRIFNQSIEQIVKLEWDDDLQYAKFMTAISKSIGKGISRYCELLETKFVKEMDRQTPEQEARVHQTQQQKWISAAKDVWAAGKNGDKIEPFQFWPESFIKINDIEYATNQLDRIEGEMGVDQLAEVIHTREPPPPPHIRARQGAKFNFTIKIIEAEDLKAGDMTGFSDPYIVLGDEYQKRLAKTRIIYQTLNPRWDETVDILTTGPLNIIATVWDWDAMGDHDCLGRTSLKLDPAHFNDYLPREYWLDLDTQGRVLVRVSMEGERDDIQFYFGKAFRTLKRTERDMTRKITDKLSAYIHQCLSLRTLKSLLSNNTTLSGVTSSARGYFSKLSSQVSGRPMSVGGVPAVTPGATQVDAARALAPLTQYFDDNFAIMKQTLTDSAMIMVMTRLWKEVLVTLEGLLVPPLSDKLSIQRQLTQQEFDIVYKWLTILFNFFHAADIDEQGRPEVNGVPLDVLKSPKYHDLQNLAFFYFEPTDSLIRTSENMAKAIANRQQETAAKLNRLSTPAFGSSLMSLTGTRRTKSIMMSRNLGTMRQAKEEKRKEAQADPSDDMILRILRMRPEAERYLKDRSRQKERLAAAAAAEAIVRQSLQASKQNAMNQQHGGAPQRRVEGGKSGLARRWDTIRE